MTPAPGPTPAPSDGTPSFDWVAIGVREHPVEHERRDHGSTELDHPVEQRERDADAPCDQETQRDRGIEVRAGRECERGDEDRDDEAVRECDVGERPCVRHRTAADEDERERADELGRAAAQIVALQHARNARRRAGRTPLAATCARRALS